MRIQMEVDDQGLIALEELKLHTGSHTYKELFANSLAILSWAIKQCQAGREIGWIDEDRQEYRKLQMSALEHASQMTATSDTKLGAA